MTELPLDFDFDALASETDEAPAGSPADPEIPANLPEVGETPQEPRLAPDGSPAPEEFPGDGAKTGKRRRTAWEVARILGGVFLAVGIFSWVMSAFVFVEENDEEDTLELPENKMESVMMEFPVGKIRHEGAIEKDKNGGPQTVFIVEIEASVVVKGNSRELTELDHLLKTHHHRIQEIMDQTIRSASKANLAEPDTLVIRSRIRDRVNALFPEPYILEVIFANYRAFRTPIKT